MAIVNVIPPKGFEFVGEVSTMNNESCMLLKIDIKRIEQKKNERLPVFPHWHFKSDFVQQMCSAKKYQLDELKEQYARDVETCLDIDGLEAWKLWQEKLKINKEWSNLVRDDCFKHELFEYRRHPHADSIIEYHRCSDEDKKRWEFKNHKGEWESMCGDEPMWDEDIEYRLPPKPFFIGKYEVPPPVTEPLEDGQDYWIFNLTGIGSNKWNGDCIDRDWLSLSIIRLTEQDAKTCFEALQKTLKGE